ncbi:MAG: hypothetical protein M1419_04920 [Bacteroidetes bacterium]|nr:hypothetical protein [Bacteroidota bacterium]
MNNETRHEKYFEEQKKDPEFRAYYIPAQEKAKLEFMLADLQDTVNNNFEKKGILKSIKNIRKHVVQIGFY